MADPTLLVILDACRRDYLTEENAPFLSSLLERSAVASIEPPPGSAPLFALLTGAHPDSSGTFGAFAYDPARSPFRWMARLGPLGALYQPRRYLAPLRLALRNASRAADGGRPQDPAWIPGPHLPHFVPLDALQHCCEPGALPLVGLFDVARAHGRRFRCLARPGRDAETHPRAVRACRDGSADLVVARLTALDHAGRTHGPLVPDGHAPAEGQTARDHARMARAVREIDRRCRELRETMAAHHERFHFVCVGDRGMAPVMSRVNILGEIGTLDLRPGKDFVALVEGAWARLWYHHADARRRITEHLCEVPYGRLVHDDERRDRRIPMGREHGDLLFAADPGVLLWPDCHHPVEAEVKGAQGYLDKKHDGGDTWGAETTGVFVLDSPDASGARELGLRSLVDVLPTLCELLDLPAPPTSEGRSLLEARRAAHA